MTFRAFRDGEGSVMGDAEQIGRQLRAAMRRKQDEDWWSWTPKQRKRARRNGEFYGEDRVERLFAKLGREPR